MSAQLRYFQLNPDVGESEADPITSLSLDIVVPTMTGGRTVELSASVVLAPADRLGDLDARIIPDTRVVEVRDYVIADRLANHHLFVEVDRPSKKALASQKDATAGERSKPVPDDLKEQ